MSQHQPYWLESVWSLWECWVSLMISKSKEWLQLSCYYLCNAICHCCRVRAPNYVKAPSKLAQEFRHSTDTFLDECIKGDGRPSTYINLVFQHCSKIQYTWFGYVWMPVYVVPIPCLHNGVSGPLLQLQGFVVEMIRWDGMHTINLGADLWVIASVMKKLMEYNLFGGQDLEESDRLLVAYDEFRTWSRRNRIEHHAYFY